MLTADVSVTRLSAGYAHRKPGVASYAGLLRTADTARREVWRCQHDHAVTASAQACAEAELDRRLQGRRVVLQLQHCTPCDVYYGPQAAGQGKLERALMDDGYCPRCGAVLEPLSAVVQP
jgi:hypothetical protein